MILRRIAQHMKQQHWTGVFIELVIVVVGVFIGLQASNWNQARQEQARSRRVTRDLVTDLATIQRMAEGIAGHCVRKTQSLGRLVVFFQSSATVPADRPQFEEDLENMSGGVLPVARSPTMVELLSSGETGLIRNEALRHALIRFDQKLQVYQLVNSKMNSAYLSYDQRLGDLAWPEFTLSGTDHTVVGIKGMHYDLATLRADPKLLPSMTALLYFYSDQVRIMRGISKRAGILEKELEATE